MALIETPVQLSEVDVPVAAGAAFREVCQARELLRLAKAATAEKAQALDLAQREHIQASRLEESRAEQLTQYMTKLANSLAMK